LHTDGLFLEIVNPQRVFLLEIYYLFIYPLKLQVKSWRKALLKQIAIASCQVLIFNELRYHGSTL